MPTPKQESLARGRGTQSVYPKGTAEQLVALCELKKKERRLEHLAWKLWWIGFDVDVEIIREFIREHWDKWDTMITDSIDSKSGKLASRTLRTLGRIANARLKLKPVRQARKRVGRVSFVRLVRTLLLLAAGNYQPTEEGELLQKGLDMTQAGHSKALSLWLPFGISDETLLELSALMRVEFRNTRLASVRNEQLIKARNTIRAIHNSLTLLRQHTERTSIRMGLSIGVPLLGEPAFQSLALRLYLAMKESHLSAEVDDFEAMMRSWGVQI